MENHPCADCKHFSHFDDKRKCTNVVCARSVADRIAKLEVAFAAERAEVERLTLEMKDVLCNCLGERWEN
jgi:hypothetical protein